MLSFEVIFKEGFCNFYYFINNQKVWRLRAVFDALMRLYCSLTLCGVLSILIFCFILLSKLYVKKILCWEIYVLTTILDLVRFIILQGLTFIRISPYCNDFLSGNLKFYKNFTWTSLFLINSKSLTLNHPLATPVMSNLWN